MSSANLVSVTYVPETVYGVPDTPLSGVTAETARFTSESLSGTPLTTESVNLRTDRMSSGQVVTGLEVGGDINIELAAGKFYEDFFEAAMMSSWVAQALLSTDVTLTPITAQSATLTITGDFSAIGVAVNDVLQLIPASGSPVLVSVISVDSTTECTVATKRDELAIAGVTMDVAVPSYVEIGSKQNGNSFTIGKAYRDVTHDVGTDEHSQTYSGAYVSGFTVSSTYGEIVTGAFNTMANGYLQEDPSMEQNIVTAGGTVNPAPTTQSLNASVDVPVVATADEGSGVLATEFCIESFEIALDNGMDPSNCIGYPAPKNYTLGTAAISITASVYLSDTSYDSLMPGKISQQPVSMTFSMTNTDGGYAFHMPAVQLTFPDPSSTGQNEQTMLEATGTAKVGANGESSLRIYQLVGDQ